MARKRAHISAARLALIALIIAGVAAAANVVKQEAPQKKRRKTGREVLAARIDRLPQAGAGWRLVESAEPARNLPDVPDITEAAGGLIDGARSSLAALTTRVIASADWNAAELAGLAKEGRRVVLVVDGEAPQDTRYIGRLRTAGATVATPTGDTAGAGRIRANLLVADERRGYLGSAAFSPDAMTHNREIGLIFDNRALARTLLAWIDYDAGWRSKHPIDQPRDALLLQTGPRERLLPNIESAREAALELINRAGSSVDVMIGEFDSRGGTYNSYVTALARAAGRGVAVRVITDEDAARLGSARQTASDLKNGGAAVRAAQRVRAAAIAVDGEWLIAGSLAWTYDADHKDRRAAALVRSTRLAAQFRRIFDSDWNAASPL